VLEATGEGGYEMMTAKHGLMALLVATGCGGMTILNPPKDVPDPLTLDECPQLCAEAIEAGCTVLECGVDVARDWALGIDILVFHLDGASDGGGGCEMVVECPEQTACTLAYGDCLQQVGDVAYCNEQYEFCEREETCSPALLECNSAVETQRDWCNENTPDEDCFYQYLLGLDVCQCVYDDCLTEESLDCAPPETAAMISPPIQTGPQAWKVSRAYIDDQLARIDALSVETRVWPVPNTDDTDWRGIRLGSIDAGEPLFALGLRSGDVIRTVNGKKAFEAAKQPQWTLGLRGASLVTLGVERQGVVRQLKYTLVD
jgi:hypothetical protein